jgi:hypothetical protein
MRKSVLLAILCSTVCLAVSSTAQTVHLLVPFTDFGIRSNIVRSVICTPVSRTTVSDSLIRFPEPRTIAINTYPAITNGSVTFSNQLSGYAYRFDFSTLTATYAITSNIGTNLTGLVNVADYTAVSTNLAAGIYAYSQAQSDALFSRIGSSTTATNLTGTATNQVNAIALAVAQSVVNTNAGGGGSGGVTNGGGIIAGMLTNATFSASGTNAIVGIVESVTNFNSTITFRGTAGSGTYGNVLVQGITTQDRSNVVYGTYYNVQDGDTGSYGYGYSSHWTVVSDGFINNESTSGTGGEGIQGYIGDVRSLYVTNSDPRFGLIAVAGYGPNVKFGSKIEPPVRRDMTYSTTANAGVFFYSMMGDGRGGWSFGDNPSGEHLLDWKSIPWVRIRGSSDTTRPQFQLEGMGAPFTGTLTNGAFFNDGTTVQLTQRGAIAPIVTESSLGYSRFYFVTNDLNVTNIVITNHVGYCVTAPITNNGMYEIEVNAIARGNQATDRPYIITWITNNVAMGYVFTSRAFNGNGYAGWSSGFEQGAPTPGFILATNTSGLDTFLGNRPISENRPVSGTAQSSTANHIIVMRLTNAPMNLFMSCSANTTGTNVLKAGSYIKVTRIE